MFRLRLKDNHILQKVNKNHYILRLFFLVISCFGYAYIYNAVLVPNHIVTGGVSGLAIIFQELFNIPTSIFIYIATAVLIVVYFFNFGKEKTINTLIGSVVFTMMVSITEPIAKDIPLNFESHIILIMVTGIIQGICNGMIYRGGFNTGGTDIIACVIVKYSKFTVGSALRMINAIIIGMGTILFGIPNTIYAILILLISSKLVDVVMLGINDSKMLFVKTNKWEKLEDILKNKYRVGVTEMGDLGGIFKKKSPTLLVIVPYHSYHELKEEIIKIDSKAFVTSLDCYMVLGGYNNKVIPF